MTLMMRNIVKYICFWLAFLSILCSCNSSTSEAEKKKARIVSLISDNICNNLSSKLSNEIDQNGTGDESIDALAIALVTALDVPIEDFCQCFTEIISRELINKFSYAELLEIKKDRVKQLMVASKILEQENIQIAIGNCLKGTINKVNKQYQDFQDSLDNKFTN